MSENSAKRPSTTPCICLGGTLFWRQFFFPEVLMTHRYIKIGATALVLVLAFAGLMWSTLREGTEYYKNLDEVMVNQEQWHGKQLQLHGYIVPGSIYRKRDSLEYKFKVQNGPARANQAENDHVAEAPYTRTQPATAKH